MSDKELRLSCINLAVTASDSNDEIMVLAEKFLAFINCQDIQPE
jgi:hypothetical protein